MGQGRGADVELAAPAVTVLAFLAVAALAWTLMIGQSWPGGDMDMGGGDMNMGAGSLASFAASWGVMMAAMMLPSATPLVFEFARNSERRRGWQAATGVLGLTYLSIWLAFGVAAYFISAAFPVSRPRQGLAGGAALVLAALYALTPIKCASEARCRELCALHGPLPFNLLRSGVVVGAQYGLSCMGCSAGLMIAMVIIGMSNLTWVVIVSGMVLVYKLTPAPSMRRRWLLSAALAALGVVSGLTP